jgi:hypothetical protein
MCVSSLDVGFAFLNRADEEFRRIRQGRKRDDTVFRCQRHDTGLLDDARFDA